MTTPSLTPDIRPPGALRLLPLIPIGMLAAASAWVLAFNPTDTVPDPTGPCLWHALFGIDGPTCGGTRMFWYLIHGDLIQAARLHLLALAGFVFGAYYWLIWAGQWLLGLRVRLPRVRRWHVIAYVVVFLVYSTILRNLPWEPFTWFYAPDLTPLS